MTDAALSLAVDFSLINGIKVGDTITVVFCLNTLPSPLPCRPAVTPTPSIALHHRNAHSCIMPNPSNSYYTIPSQSPIRALTLILALTATITGRCYLALPSPALHCRRPKQARLTRSRHCHPHLHPHLHPHHNPDRHCNSSTLLPLAL